MSWLPPRTLGCGSRARGLTTNACRRSWTHLAATYPAPASASPVQEVGVFFVGWHSRAHQDLQRNRHGGGNYVTFSTRSKGRGNNLSPPYLFVMARALLATVSCLARVSWRGATECSPCWACARTQRSATCDAPTADWRLSTIRTEEATPPGSERSPTRSSRSRRAAVCHTGLKP